MEDLDTFTRAYLRAMFFTEDGDRDPEMEDKGVADLAPESLEQIKADCAAFQAENAEAIAVDLEQAGYDFWFTRNGHGVGFWDGDWGELGDQLDKACDKYKETDVFVGDDGLVYVS